MTKIAIAERIGLEAKGNTLKAELNWRKTELPQQEQFQFILSTLPLVHKIDSLIKDLKSLRGSEAKKELLALASNFHKEIDNLVKDSQESVSEPESDTASEIEEIKITIEPPAAAEPIPLERGIVVNEDVNLLEPAVPDADLIPDPKNQVTIGDLHGNALKLLHFLMRYHFVSLSDKDYKKFVGIYNLEPEALTSTHLETFNQILSRAKFHANAGMIHFIGDELADRGSNDYFTLKIFEKLSQHQVPFEIIISNHGIEFLKDQELKDPNYKTAVRTGQDNSYVNLGKLIESKLVTQNEVTDLVEQHYKPYLKALSYTHDEKGTTLYTHAPVGLETIRRIAAVLKISYSANSHEELRATIDKINSEFHRTILNPGKVDNRFNKNLKFSKDPDDISDRVSRNPFYRLVWNRDLNNIVLVMPNGDPLQLVHGHTDGELFNAINLDNTLGKAMGHFKGEHDILLSQETPAPQVKLNLTEEAVFPDFPETESPKVSVVEEDTSEQRQNRLAEIEGLQKSIQHLGKRIVENHNAMSNPLREFKSKHVQGFIQKTLLPNLLSTDPVMESMLNNLSNYRRQAEDAMTRVDTQLTEFKNNPTTHSLKQLREIMDQLNKWEKESAIQTKELLAMVNQELAITLDALEKIDKVIEIILAETMVLKGKKPAFFGDRIPAGKKVIDIEKAIEATVNHLHEIIHSSYTNTKSKSVSNLVSQFLEYGSDSSIKKSLSAKRGYFSSSHMFNKIDKAITTAVIPTSEKPIKRMKK